MRKIFLLLTVTVIALMHDAQAAAHQYRARVKGSDDKGRVPSLIALTTPIAVHVMLANHDFRTAELLSCSNATPYLSKALATQLPFLQTDLDVDTSGGASWSPTGNHFVAGSYKLADEGEMQLYSWNRKGVVAIGLSSPGDADCVEWSSTGEYCALHSENSADDNQVQSYCAELYHRDNNGLTLIREFCGENKAHVSFSPKFNLVVACSENRIDIYLLDGSESVSIGSFQGVGPYVNWSRSGEHVTFGTDAKIGVYRVCREEVVQVGDYLLGMAIYARWSHGDCLSVGTDVEVSVYRVSENGVVQVGDSIANSASSVGWSATRDCFTAGGVHEVGVYRVDENRIVQVGDSFAGTGYSVCWSATGDRFTAGVGNEIGVFRIDENQLVPIETFHTEGSLLVCWSPTGRYLFPTAIILYRLCANRLEPVGAALTGDKQYGDWSSTGDYVLVIAEHEFQLCKVDRDCLVPVGDTIMTEEAIGVDWSPTREMFLALRGIHMRADYRLTLPQLLLFNAMLRIPGLVGENGEVMLDAATHGIDPEKVMEVWESINPEIQVQMLKAATADHQPTYQA